MKISKIKKTLVLICISFTLLACSSSSKDEEYRQAIVGCWYAPAELTSFSYYYIFNEDNSYHAYNISDVGFKTISMEAHGTYEINNESIKFVPDNGTSGETKINEITNENFILQEGNNRLTATRISQEQMNQILSESGR